MAKLRVMTVGPCQQPGCPNVANVILVDLDDREKGRFCGRCGQARLTTLQIAEDRATQPPAVMPPLVTR
jgi:hypothetical protein